MGKRFVAVVIALLCFSSMIPIACAESSADVTPPKITSVTMRNAGAEVKSGDVVYVDVAVEDESAVEKATDVAEFSVETGDCIVDQETGAVTLYASYSAPEVLKDSPYCICINIYDSPTSTGTYKGEYVETITEVVNDKKIAFELQPIDLYNHELIPSGTYYYKACIIDAKNDIICEGEFKSFIVPGQINEISLGNPGLVKAEHTGIPCQWYSFTALDTNNYMLDFNGEGNLIIYSQNENGVLKRTFRTAISNNQWVTHMFKKGERTLIGLGYDGLIDCTLAIDKVNVDIALDANSGIWQSGDSQTHHVFIWDSEFSTSPSGITGYSKGVCELAKYREALYKNGEILIGWNTMPDGSGTYYGTMDCISTDNPNICRNRLTLYAQWYEKKANQSTIFLANGGAFESGDTIYECTDGFAPSATKPDSKLIGWVDSIDNCSTIYFPGNSITSTNKDILYAYWLSEKSKDCVIIFDPAEDVQRTKDNCLLRREQATKYYKGSTICHLINYFMRFYRPGYVQIGWNTSEDGSGKHYGLKDKINVRNEFGTGNIIHLYAEWEKLDLPDNYYVFIPSEGTFSDGAAYKVVNRNEEFEFPKIECNDRQLIGWHNQPIGWSITDYHIFEEAPETLVNKNLYMYPLWAYNDEISLVLVYNGGYVNGDLVENASGTHAPIGATCVMTTYSTVESIPYYYQLYATKFVERISDSIEKDGFRFSGWNTKSDGSGIQYTGGNLPDGAAKVFLFAQWEKVGTGNSGSSTGSSQSNTNTITASNNISNGTVSVLPMNATEGDTVTITVTPDYGYELDTITAKDASGKTVKLTDNGNGKYIFTMPASKVTISAVFVKTQPSANFTDVPSDAYYAKAVEWAVKNGITNGKGNGLFGSNDPCTRGQIVTFLWRAAGSPAPKGTAVVPADVVPGSYCYDAVAWALENGITNGFSDGTFGVNSTCTRGQSVTFLYRTVGKAPSTASGFTDVAADSFCADAVAWAAECDITNGTTNTTFSPNGGCTRSQIITFLYRAYQENTTSR